MQQPLLTNGRPQVQLGRASVEQKNIGIVLGALRSRFRENEVRLVRYVGFGVAKTAAARELHVSLDRAMPVEPVWPGR